MTNRSHLRNFLEETIKCLQDNGKSPSEVLWVGDRLIGYFTWDDFKDVANIEYDPGFGSAEINDQIIIVGDNWWMERQEYDGSEWWEFKTLPQKPSYYKKPTKILGDKMWK